MSVIFYFSLGLLEVLVVLVVFWGERDGFREERGYVCVLLVFWYGDVVIYRTHLDTRIKAKFLYRSIQLLLLSFDLPGYLLLNLPPQRSLFPQNPGYLPMDPTQPFLLFSYTQITSPQPRVIILEIWMYYIRSCDKLSITCGQEWYFVAVF